MNTTFVTIIMELVGCEVGEGRETGFGGGCRWSLSSQSMEVWNFASTLSMYLLDMVLRNGESLT